MKLVGLTFLAIQTSALRAEDTAPNLERAPEVINEPMHSELFRNATIRVYEVAIPGKSSTLFHRHTLNGVGIDMTPNRLAVEKIGSDKSEFTTTSGDFFPVTVAEPYVHRVINLEATPYMALVAERLENKPLGRESSALQDVAGFKLELETDLVRAFRLVVRPGESTPKHTVGANTLIVALSGGLVSVSNDNRPSVLQAVAPGQLTWFSKSVTSEVFNSGAAEYSVAYLEWK